MNILIDALPESVVVGGTEYRIETGFRTSILFELLIRDRRIPDHLKLSQMLKLYYPRIPDDEEEAAEKILWFYNCGRQRGDARNRTAPGFRRGKALYSFEQDAFLIYAAFYPSTGLIFRTSGTCTGGGLRPCLRVFPRISGSKGS